MAGTVLVELRKVVQTTKTTCSEKKDKHALITTSQE